MWQALCKALDNINKTHTVPAVLDFISQEKDRHQLWVVHSTVWGAQGYQERACRKSCHSQRMCRNRSGKHRGQAAPSRWDSMCKGPEGSRSLCGWESVRIYYHRGLARKWPEMS